MTRRSSALLFVFFAGCLALLLLLCGCTKEVEPPSYAHRTIYTDKAGWQQQRYQPPQQISYDIWHESRMVAHAMGAVDGFAGTNSMDAFYASYEKGFRVFEVDMILSADGQLVLRHDWDETTYDQLGQSTGEAAETMDFRTFRHATIAGKFTPMTVEDLIRLLRRYPDIWIITDTKEIDADRIEQQFQALYQAFRSQNATSCASRMVVQLYHYDMKEIVDQFGIFSNYAFTLYQMYNPNLRTVGRYCAEQGIPAVIMPVESATAQKVATLNGYGVKVYLHTVNSRPEMTDGIREMAVYGYYSDFVTPKQLERHAKNESSFVDVLPDDPCYAAVCWAVDAGYMSGSGQTNTFFPYSYISWNSICTVLYTIAGQPPVQDPPQDLRFAGYRDDAWYSDAVRWAVANNILLNGSHSLSAYDDRPSAEEVEQMLKAFARYHGGTFSELHCEDIYVTRADFVTALYQTYATP